jgi:hypothetical protein
MYTRCPVVTQNNGGFTYTAQNSAIAGTPNVKDGRNFRFHDVWDGTTGMAVLTRDVSKSLNGELARKQ